MKDLETRLRLSRLKTEAYYLGQKYGRVSFDQEDGTWVHIDKFPIGPGWNKTHIEILIDIPRGTPGYPSVAPQWFWTDRNLRTRDGKNINHFFTEQRSDVDLQYLQKGWGHFCIHVNEWHPSADIIHGHSLLSYLELISVVFRDRKTLARG